MTTTVKQGGIGMSAAIYKLTQLGYTVSIPLIDNQEYDLIADFDYKLYKVEVKSTSVKTPSGWAVQIKKVRPNRTTNVITAFDPSKIDLLFVYTIDGDCYLIPSDDIDTRNQLTVPGKFECYKI